MAAEDNQSESTPFAPKSSPGEQAASNAPGSSGSSSLSLSEYWKLINKTQEIDKDIAARVADTPFQSGNPNVWGVLTALSNRASKRKQGLNMFLKENVHFMGGLVEDYQFQIDSPFVSRVHCKIYRQTFASEDDALKSQPLVFLKDMSSNGTYVNRIRYTRRDKAVQIHHGDTISLVKPLCRDSSFSFMYREVLKSDTASSNGVLAKRKPAEELVCETKRVKRVGGVGAPEVAITLDDFRGLQHSNAELLKKLEDRGVTMLQNENIASMLHHYHQTVDQKRGLSETMTEIMEDSSRWGEAEAEAGNCFVGISNDDDEEQQLFKPPPSQEEEEESMGSCPPESEKEEEEEEDDEEDFCSLDSNTCKIDYQDSDSEESGEEVVSELCDLKRQRSCKKLSDDEREFGFDSDGLLIIEESKSAANKEELLVKLKQQDEDEDEEESKGSSPNSVTTSSSETTYFGVTAAAGPAALNLNLKKKRMMMSSVTSSHSLHTYFGLTTNVLNSKKKKKTMTPPSVQCCYFGLCMNSRKNRKRKKRKTISSVTTTFQSVHNSSSGHDSDVESGDELVSRLVFPDTTL